MCPESVRRGHVRTWEDEGPRGRTLGTDKSRKEDPRERCPREKDLFSETGPSDQTCLRRLDPRETLSRDGTLGGRGFLESRPVKHWGPLGLVGPSPKSKD